MNPRQRDCEMKIFMKFLSKFAKITCWYVFNLYDEGKTPKSNLDECDNVKEHEEILQGAEFGGRKSACLLIPRLTKL